jgi:sugar phosphate isomerase/epimerase
MLNRWEDQVMNVGASTIAFRNEPLNINLLRQMKECGIGYLELTDYHAGFDYADEAAFAVLKEAIAQLDLQVYTLHAHLEYLDPTCQLTATTAAARAHLLRSYRQAIDAFSSIGGGILVTHDHGVPDVDAAAHEDALAALIENLEAIARYAAAQNIRIAVENLTSGYFSDLANLLALVEDVDAENLGICIDTGHRNLHGDPAQALRLVGDRLFTVHIHDNNGSSDDHLLPLSGNIHWPTVLEALTAIGYPGIFMYELSRPADLAQVCRNFAELKH